VVRLGGSRGEDRRLETDGPASAGLSTGRHLPQHRGRTPTLAEYGQRWLSQCRVRPKTLHRCEELLKHTLPSLGCLQLTRLEPHHVGNLLSRLRDDGLSARTCNHVLAVFRNLLSEAKREGIVLRNVAELAGPLPVSGHE
jgi:hypothetical protein